MFAYLTVFKMLNAYLGVFSPELTRISEVKALQPFYSMIFPSTRSWPLRLRFKWFILKFLKNADWGKFSPKKINWSLFELATFTNFHCVLMGEINFIKVLSNMLPAPHKTGQNPGSRRKGPSRTFQNSVKIVRYNR